MTHTYKYLGCHLHGSRDPPALTHGRPRTPATPGHRGESSVGLTTDTATALKE